MQQQIETVIEDIKTDLASFHLSKEHLSQFSETSEDKEYLSYVNGRGGNYIKFLALFVKKLQFKNIVELGNREGLSTLAIYSQLPATSRFSTIDLLKDQRYCPKPMFSDKRVNFLFGDVCDPDIIKDIPFDIDFLFSDTIHYYSQIKDEFEIYQHLLADTAIVAIDDIHTNDKGVFWDEINHPKWDLTSICHVSGWGLFLFKRHYLLSIEERKELLYKAGAKIWKRKYDELLEEKQLRIERSLGYRVKKSIKKHPSLYKKIISTRNYLSKKTC